MRILTFTNLFPNSIDPVHGIFVYQRVAHWAKRPGNEARIVAPVPYFPRWLKAGRWQSATAIPEEEQIDGLEVYHPRYFLVPKISMSWQALAMFVGSLRTVLAIHRRWKIDLIDAHYVYPDGMAAVLLAKHLGVPVVVSARGTDINLFSTFPIIRSWIRWTLAHADGVVAVSAALREVMIRMGVGRGSIRVIPNGIDVSRFQPVPAAEARRKLGLAEETPIVVSVGSLTPAKGHDLVIGAFKRMAPRHDGLQLYILGEGTYRRELERMVNESGLSNRVHLVGKRPNEELHLWFNAATVSCLASSREGWPNVVTESLACGTPVVATRVGGIPEILDSEELGVLVDATADSVAAGLERALTHPWNRAAISSRTHLRSWDVVAREIDELFEGVIEPHGKEAQEKA